jgi:hypothetical protein
MLCISSYELCDQHSPSLLLNPKDPLVIPREPMIRGIVFEEQQRSMSHCTRRAIILRHQTIMLQHYWFVHQHWFFELQLIHWIWYAFEDFGLVYVAECGSKRKTNSQAAAEEAATNSEASSTDAEEKLQLEGEGPCLVCYSAAQSGASC